MECGVSWSNVDMRAVQKIRVREITLTLFDGVRFSYGAVLIDLLGSSWIHRVSLIREEFWDTHQVILSVCASFLVRKRSLEIVGDQTKDSRGSNGSGKKGCMCRATAQTQHSRRRGPSDVSSRLRSLVERH
mmetsp:Transcript_79619/g.158980  ORF Transcript_79619/g.158980 Transcript_79619/m.158980 type:complete len:131 (+) Transcript_79619:103-495(+)